MAESLKQKTVKGVGWSFADNIANQGITFLVGLVLARFIIPEEYGLIGIILIFVAVFDSIINCGFSSALIRKNDADDMDYNTVFIVNMVLSVVLFIAFFFSAGLIADFFSQPLLEPLTQVMGGIVIIHAFAIIQRTILIKRLDFRTQTKASIISSVGSGIIGISMALNEYGVWSLVGQQLSRAILNTGCIWFYSHWYPKLQFSWYSFKCLFEFGWKLSVSSLIDTMWKEIYQVVIGKFYTPTMLGQYTQAYQFSSIFSSNLNSVIKKVSYPVLSKLQDNKQQLKEGYRRVIKVTMLITFVFMLGLAAMGKTLICILIGEQWLIAADLLPVICFQMLLYPLHSLNLSILQVLGYSNLFLRLEIIKKSIGIIPIILGVFFSIYWMLWASVITGIIAYYLNSYYTGKFLNYNIISQIKDIYPSFCVALIMSITVWLLSFLPLSLYILFPLQIILGVGIVFSLCEKIKMTEYIELKSIIESVFRKFSKIYNI